MHVEGLRGHIVEPAPDEVPLHDQIEVGMYVKRADERQHWRRAPEECPYCRGVLYESLTPMFRVKTFQPEMLLDAVPSTHRALTCGPCKQTFVSPSVGVRARL